MTATAAQSAPPPSATASPGAPAAPIPAIPVPPVLPARHVRLAWKHSPVGRIDGTGLRPDLVAALPDAALAERRLRIGRREVRWDDAFDITSAPVAAGEVPTLTVPGSPQWVDLGSGTAAGTLVVEGHAGHRVGRGMTGGSIDVLGDAGHEAGAGMAGGLLRVRGRAGDGAGGPAPDTERGMTGGELLVHGDAGAGIGRRMRRGLIAVAGQVGDGPGLAMIAGTIVVGRGPLLRPGVDNRRGTIWLLEPGVPSDARSAAPDDLPPWGPGYTRDGVFAPVILRVVLRRLMTLGFPLPAGVLDRRWEQWSGDRLRLHRGELFLPAPGGV